MDSFLAAPIRPDWPLRTERLTLRPWAEGDFEAYATEAARALLRWAFEEVGFHRVYGRTEPRNEASGRVMEKLGMRKEAHFVENEWVKGEWQSEVVYAMLEREWALLRGDS